jgi:hypothetical protein
MTVDVRPTLWVSLLTVSLAYGLLGWQLSAQHIFWSIGSLTAVFIFTIASVWGGGILGRMMRIGPRGLITMLIFSLALTLAASAPTAFAEILILVATQLFTRLEFQTAGFSRSITLVILLSVSSTAFSCGWLIGYHIFPSNPLWLS